MSTCPKCQGAMESGFVPDYSYATILPQRWTEGPVNKSFLGNLKVKGRRQLPVTADRCTKCGYLEFYARA
ncbi:MAG TPA: hypothetical protein VK438_13855 [Xanthobacteraceae bacterium]|nr:hypothetical protein [Xanthobacteraceae bacterium]